MIEFDQRHLHALSGAFLKLDVHTCFMRSAKGENLGETLQFLFLPFTLFH